VLQPSGTDRLSRVRTYVQAAKSKRWSMNVIWRSRSFPAPIESVPSGSCGLLRSLEWFAGAAWNSRKPCLALTRRLMAR
jgi:hypothetical protein